MEEIKVRNFKEDFENSKLLNNQWTKIFNKFFGDDITITFKEDNNSQLNYGVDVIITTKKGRRYTIEHKTRREEYLDNPNYLLEIAHHRYRDVDCNNKINTVPGWLYKGTFDYIFIGTINEKREIIECVGFSSIPFKLEEFKSEYNNLKNGWAKTKFENGTYQLTLNKKVTIQFLKDNALKFWYWRDHENT